MAFVRRIQVLNQHERHARIVRQMAEQFRECLQAAGGGANPANRECNAFASRASRWLGDSHRGDAFQRCGFRYLSLYGFPYSTLHDTFSSETLLHETRAYALCRVGLLACHFTTPGL